MACAAVVLGELSIPQEFWNRVFVSKLASSSNSAEFLVRAAGEGELGTLKALVTRGVPIGATNYEGSTALHYAACAGKPAVVRYLIGAGANVNAVNHYGDSPLVCAKAKGESAMVQMLEAAGGREIQGTEEQRNRAIKEMVEGKIEKLQPWLKEPAK